jgi:hypothetical protein
LRKLLQGPETFFLEDSAKNFQGRVDDRDAANGHNLPGWVGNVLPGLKFDGFVKSPSAALRFNLVVAAHL